MGALDNIQGGSFNAEGGSSLNLKTFVTNLNSAEINLADVGTCIGEVGLAVGNISKEIRCYSDEALYKKGYVPFLQNLSQFTEDIKNYLSDANHKLYSFLSNADQHRNSFDRRPYSVFEPNEVRIIEADENTGSCIIDFSNAVKEINSLTYNCNKVMKNFDAAIGCYKEIFRMAQNSGNGAMCTAANKYAETIRTLGDQFKDYVEKFRNILDDYVHARKGALRQTGESFTSAMQAYDTALNSMNFDLAGADENYSGHINIVG